MPRCWRWNETATGHHKAGPDEERAGTGRINGDARRQHRSARMNDGPKLEEWRRLRAQVKAEDRDDEPAVLAPPPKRSRTCAAPPTTGHDSEYPRRQRRRDRRAPRSRGESRRAAPAGGGRRRPGSSSRRCAQPTPLWHPSVDATNWRAEQAIRPAVVIRKVCGGNRTRHGADTQQVLASVVRTAHQRHLDLTPLIVAMLRSPRPTVLDALRRPPP